MVIDVYDTKLDRRGVVEKFDSFIWTRRYSNSGDFKLLVPYSDKYMKLLKMRRLIENPGDEEMGYIAYIQITENSQGHEQIEIQGKLITSWIGKRIVRHNIAETSTMPEIMHRIVRESVTDPTAPARRIPNISHAPITGITRPRIEYAVKEYDNALAALEYASIAAHLGYGIYADKRAKTFEFRVYDGLDRTVGQKVNSPAKFSKEFENIHAHEYINCIDNLRTTAYVGGENREGTPRQIVEVNEHYEGLDRSELFVNASGIRQTYRNENNQEVIIPLNQYLEMLRQRGLSELENHAENTAFTSTINTRSTPIYRQGYDLGDIVTCENKKWGVRTNVRITEIDEVHRKDREKEIYVTFGENIQTLFSALKQIIRQG